MKSPQNGIFVVIGFAMSFATSANEQSGYITESGIRVLPILESKIEHVDNIGRLSDAQKAQSSTVFVIEPGVVLSSDRNGNSYNVLYQLSSGHYFDSSDDNYIDHKLISNNSIQLSRRHAIGINYAYINSHQERGTGLLAGDELSTIADEPVRFSIHSASLTYAFGSQGAKGLIESNIKYENKRFDNYRDITLTNYSQLSTRYKDYDEFGGGLGFYYRLSPSTQLLTEFNLASRDYKLNDPETNQSQDNLDTYYYVGARWDLTGKTEGKFRVGLQDKNYEDKTKTDFDGVSWDLEFSWKPVNYSTFSLAAALRALDPYQGSDFVDRTSFEGDWKHFWVSNFYSKLALDYIQDDYSGSQREDELIRTDVSLGYELRQYMGIAMGWRQESNDSSIESNTYDQNVWYLSANLLF